MDRESRAGHRWRFVLCDLDGTLTDPADGITRSAVHALRSRGHPAAEPEALRFIVGPPLRATLARLAGTGDPDEVAALIAAYRERFAPVGIYENRVYPGIPELLADCVSAGCTLGLATAKPAVFARRILRHFGLGRHFAVVAGSYLDGRRSDKAALVRHALRALGADPASAVMVGDRAQDVEGARACGVAAAAVRWGYAEPGELEAARPAALCAEVSGLRRLLLGAGTSRGARRDPPDP